MRKILVLTAMFAMPPAIVPAAAAEAVAVSTSALSNFAKVSDVLYRGAQPDREGFEQLKRLGIKTIVNLRASHSDEELIEGLGLRYYPIPVRPWSVDDETSARFLKIMSDPSNHPVFVHCQHGADRTGAMVAVYRIYTQAWHPDDALAELPRYGFHKIWLNLPAYLRKLDLKSITKELESLSD